MKSKDAIIVTARGAKRVVDMPEWYGGGYELVSGRGIKPGVYGKSPWAFACMQIRGSELANLPWRLRDASGKTVESHAIIDMLKKFGDESNYAEAVQATEIDLLMRGSGYWLRDQDKLERLNASTIKVKAEKSGIKSFVQLGKSGKEINKFAREEIVYFREYHPETDLEPGVPVMDVIKKAIAIEYESSLYTEAFFINDATPSLLLTTDQAIQEADMNRLLAWWNKTFRGSKKSQKVGLLDKGLKAQILSHSMREIAMVELRDQARNDICVGFRVPKILVGSMVDSTYANAQEARKFMLEDVTIPRSKYFEDVINADLIQRIDTSVVFEFLPQEVQILQEGANDKWKRLSDAIDKSAISLEFARSQMGWPETAAPVATDRPDSGVMRSWRRKAKKALKKRGSADVEFETDEIPARVQAAIRANLAAAKTGEEVERAFEMGLNDQPITVVVNVPEPAVTVNVPETSVVVHPPDVTVNVPEIKIPPIEVKVPVASTSEEETELVRDKRTGAAKGSKSKITHKYEKDK